MYKHCSFIIIFNYIDPVNPTYVQYRLM